MGKNTCRGEHRGHLCAIAKAGRLDKIVKLSGQPRYICKKCGRVAHCAGNLCHPKSFD